MARIGQLIYAPEVQDKASGPLNAIGQAADRAGAAFEGLDTRVRRNEASFDQVAARLDVVERAAQKVERATSGFTRAMEAAERQALAEGVAQERLSAVLVSGAAAREAAALQAVRGLTAEQQAAALTRAGYANLATQVQATAQAQSNLGVTASQRLAAANDNVVASSGNMRAALGQAGFQVQDFATQVSMGQNALMAFGVQFSQLAGFFGPAGAIAGAGVMIGVIAAQLLLGKSAADAFTESMTRQSDALKMVEEDARRYREGLADEARQVRELTDYYGSLSQARQSQEMRQFRRDQVDLEATQDRLRTDALGSTSGLSRAFQSQLSEAQLMAERDYGRGSAEFGLIMSSPDLQRMREFVAVVEGFRETGDVSREALARLYQQMLGLADGSDVVSRRIRAQAEVIDGLTGKAREAEQAQAALSARAQALGFNVDSAATAADRLNRQLAAMSRYDQGISTNLGAEISRLQREFAAASVGAERLQQVRAQLSREDRLERMVSDRRKELEERGITGGAATASLEEFRSQIEPTLNRIGQLQDGIRGLEAGFRNTGSAIREASQEFQDLRRHTSGLLVGNTVDVRNIEEITRQIRGTQLDPAVRERARAEAQREVERSFQTIERQNQQTTDSIVRYGADRFADMFSENSRGWAGMLDTFRSTFRSLMARLAAEAVIRPIVAPIVQSLGLGGVGSGGGLGSILGGGSVMGGASGVADPGGMQGGLNQAGQLLGLRSAGGFGNLGNAFTNQGMANTGLGFVDSALNYSLINAPNTSGFATGTAMAGEAGAFAGGGGAAAPGGLSVAGALGGAASIAGGAYGVYSGLQRGGIGGYTSAAGGALSAGLGVAMLAGATIPVAGWVLAGLLAIAGAALPGQQQSGRGQLSRINLDTANQSFEGLGGDRFSQGNRDAATNTVNSIADMARRIGDQLGGARIGGDVAVGVTSGRGSGPGQLYLQVGANTQAFANDEAGSKQLAETAARLILDEFRRQGTAQGDYAGILAASPTVEVLSQNLEWYEKTYKVLTQATQPVSAFQQSIDQLTAQFEPAIQKARELSLSVDDMTAARERELQKLRDERGIAARNFGNNLDIRMARAVGDNYNADLLAFDVQAEQQLKTARAELEALGLTAEEVAAGIARTERTLGAERLAIVRSYAESAAGSALGVITSLRDYSRGLRTTDAGAGTALDRYTAAARQFDAIYGAAVAGDARSISSLQGAAETFRTNAREVFGGGQGYADALRVIGQRIDAIGLMGPEALTQSFIAENNRQNTQRVVDAIAALRADVNLLLMRPAAA